MTIQSRLLRFSILAATALLTAHCEDYSAAADA